VHSLWCFPPRPSRRVLLLIGGLALFVHGLLLAPVWFPLQAAMGWIWAGVVPGALVAHLLLADDRALRIVERILLASGLGYVSAVLGTLILHYLPGPLTHVHLLVFYDALVLVLLLMFVVRTSRTLRGTTAPARNSDRQTRWLPLLVVFLIAAFFRLTNLGYSEIQGDEAEVLHKATASLRGDDDALFLHKKGPAEILLVALTYAASRRINEGVARFPFAMANLLGVMGLYALGRRLFSYRAGWWAALLVALNGFLVAFGRIAQYQSLVLLFSVLGLLCALRFKEALDRRYLWLSALFLASGLLAHTDASFATAAAALLILRTFLTRRVALTTAVRWVVGPILVAGVLLAVFYVPFVLHPHFQEAQRYLNNRMGQPPYNNLNHFLTVGTVYNAVYYLALVGGGLVWTATARVSRISQPRWLLPGVVVALLAILWLWPVTRLVGERDAIGAVFLALLLTLLLLPGESLGWQIALLWFGLPFLMYGFLFHDPQTHLYALFPGASLLWAEALDRLIVRLKYKAWLLNVAVAAVLTISTLYLYIMFVNHTPEYKRTYPKHRIHFFWVPYGDELPIHGFYGFPYRAGWKVIGYLYSAGLLQGDYSTNEETHITRWYTRGQPACYAHPRYYFLAENVQDEQSVPLDKVASAYQLIGRVWVGDRVKLRMYERKAPRLTLQDYRVERISAGFDQQYTGPDYQTGLSPLDPLAEVQHPAQLQVGPAIEFLGHTVDKTRAWPGQALTLTLYWRALSPIEESYTVFTHVEDQGVVWGQKDGIPGCGLRPTYEWEVGHMNADRYTLILSPDAPPGPHHLVAGMYRRDTGERLSIVDTAGISLGTTLDLGTIDVVLPGGR
jgi:hypothetical protein